MAPVHTFALATAIAVMRVSAVAAAADSDQMFPAVATSAKDRPNREASCACPPPLSGATRGSRAIPQTCRLCGGMIGTNAATGDLDVHAPPGGKVVVMELLVAKKAVRVEGPLVLHAADVSHMLHKCATVAG